MCSGCYSDPAWDEIHYRRQGAVGVEDFYKEVNYTKKSKKKNVKKYPGCPGNEGKAHIYVWTTEFNGKSLFFDFYGFHKFEKKICAGCGHKDRSRRTEEYNRRNEKVFAKREPRRHSSIRWFSFEDYDDEYREKRSAYTKRWGWDYEYISSWG